MNCSFLFPQLPSKKKKRKKKPGFLSRSPALPVWEYELSNSDKITYPNSFLKLCDYRSYCLCN